MTATAFVDAIKKLTWLLPLQSDQLIALAPKMTDAQRLEALAAVKTQNDTIGKNVQEMDEIQDKVEKETKAIYKKEWPKIKNAIQEEERSSAAAKLDAQIDAA